MRGDLAWDDIRLFLALMRAKKLGVAAKMLGLDASTLSRRLVALERRCGIRLFERTRDGLAPTAAADALVDPAKGAEDSVRHFFEQVRPVEKLIAGRVRITAPPGVVELLVMPAAVELLRHHPKLRLEIDASETVASLLRREADIAVRLIRPTGEGLVIRRLGSSPNAIFCSRELAKSLGELASYEAAPWVAWDKTRFTAPTARWFASHVRVEPVLRASTLLGQITAVEASLGVAVLPVFVAEARGLVRVQFSGTLSASSIPSDEMYLACPAALREVPRIRAVWAFLLERLARSSSTTKTR